MHVEPDAEALAIWQRGRPVAGSLAEEYLTRHRGLAGPFPPSLRFLSYVRYPHSGIDMPAMVAAVSCSDRKIIAVQLTYLRESDGAKAKVYAPRITVGRLGGGSVHLAAHTDCLGLAEGTETALAAMQLSGVPVWSVLGGQRLCKPEIPNGVKEVHIFADNDDAGKLAAERAAGRYTLDGLKVLLRWPPPEFKDWNDALLMQRRAAA